jgi:hypothetical protein
MPSAYRSRRANPSLIREPSMRRARRWPGAWLLISSALALGCGQHLQVSPAASFALFHGAGFDGTCIGTGLAAIVRGDPADIDVAWVESLAGARRSNVDWPLGYTARFRPALEIVDSTGAVVLRDGDFVDGTCGTDSDGRLRLAQPFLALRLDCGPVDLLRCPALTHRAAADHGWPEKDVASVQFTSADGAYRLMFEDGSVITGGTN